MCKCNNIIELRSKIELRWQHAQPLSYLDLLSIQLKATNRKRCVDYARLAKYIELINRDDFDPEEQADVYTKPEYERLWPLVTGRNSTYYRPTCRNKREIWLEIFKFPFRFFCGSIWDQNINQTNNGLF